MRDLVMLNKISNYVVAANPITRVLVGVIIGSAIGISIGLALFS